MSRLLDSGTLHAILLGGMLRATVMPCVLCGDFVLQVFFAHEVDEIYAAVLCWMWDCEIWTLPEAVHSQLRKNSGMAISVCCALMQRNHVCDQCCTLSPWLIA